MEKIFCFFLFAGFFYFVFKMGLPDKKSKDDLYFDKVCDSVRELSEIVESLNHIEDIITDIECSSHSRLRAVRLSVANITDCFTEHDFLIDGNDLNSKQLLSIAYNERERLRTLLLTSIKNLYRYGVTEKITETMSDEERGEE